jgi:hypothetical protein
MGVRSVEVQNAFAADLEKMNQIELPAGKVDPPRKQYLLRPDSNNAYRAVNRLFKAGAQVGRLKAAVRDGTREFPAGTFVVHSSAVRDLAGLGVDFSATDLPLGEATAMRAPRVGLYKSYLPSMDEGWTRWLLEQFEFPYTSIYDKDVREGKLGGRFDVIVIPDQSVSALVEGHPALSRAEPGGIGGESRAGRAPERSFFQGPVPDEFTGGVGSAGVAGLREFVMQGGTLVTLNGASDFPIERLAVGTLNVLHGVANRDFYGPGSILRINVNPNHPVGYGMDSEAAAWFEHSGAFAPAFESAAAPGAVTVASYPNGNPLMSGWLLGDALLQNRSAVMDAPLGRGHVVLFGFRPQYRGQSYGTFKMLFNALYYFGER